MLPQEFCELDLELKGCYLNEKGQNDQQSEHTRVVDSIVRPQNRRNFETGGRSS